MQKENILLLFGANSTLEWGRSYQIAKAFAELGHATTYIDLPHPITNSFSSRKPTGVDRNHVVTFQPVCGLPCAKMPWLRRFNYLLIKFQIVRYLEKVGFNPTIIWAYAPYEPMITRDLRTIFDPKLVVHDIADERIALAEAQSGARAGTITKQYEEELSGYCDAVITITDKLKATKRHLHNSIVVMPNGIDTGMFNADAEYPKPDHMEILTGKIVLYIGAVEEWVDIEAIKVAANANLEAQFVLVGPIRIDISQLTQLENVHVIGTRPYAEMPAWIAHADVCILPFKDNEITRNSDPLKLLQYLSMGKPTVALQFQGLNDFGGTVMVADDYKEFSELIHLSGAKRSSAPEVVKRYDWKCLTSEVVRSLCNLI